MYIIFVFAMQRPFARRQSSRKDESQWCNNHNVGTSSTLWFLWIMVENCFFFSYCTRHRYTHAHLYMMYTNTISCENDLLVVNVRNIFSFMVFDCRKNLFQITFIPWRTKRYYLILFVFSIYFNNEKNHSLIWHINI